MINIFVGLEYQKHSIKEHQEDCDIIQKLHHAEKWVFAIVSINLARNWKWALFRLTTDKKHNKMEFVCANLC